MGEYFKISLETPQRKLWPFGLLNLLDKNILKAFDILCTCKTRIGNSGDPYFCGKC